jgi:hypothetical protein
MEGGREHLPFGANISEKKAHHVSPSVQARNVQGLHMHVCGKDGLMAGRREGRNPKEGRNVKEETTMQEGMPRKGCQGSKEGRTRKKGKEEKVQCI